MMKKADYILGGVLIAVAVFFFHGSFFFEQGIVGDRQLGEAFFPRLLSVLLFALAVLLIYRTARAKGGEDGSLALFAKGKLPLFTVVVLGIYVFTMEELGFLVSTMALNYALMLIFRVRNLTRAFIFPPALTFATYWIFAKVLLVPLPEGILYF